MKKNTINIIFKSYIKSTWKLKFAFILVFWFITWVVTVLEPLFFAEIIKYLEEFYKTWKFNLNDFINLIIYWSLFIAFTLIIHFFYRYNLVDKTCINNYVDENKKFSKKILSMSYWEYLWKKQGKIYRIFDVWNNSQFRFLFFFFLEVLKNKSWMIVIIWILFYLNWVMALLVLSMLPIMLLAWYYFYTKLHPYQKELHQKWTSVFGVIWDAMSNFWLIKTLSLENTFIKKIDNIVDNVYDKQLTVSKWWSISDVYTWILVMISRILVLGFWVYFVINWTLSLAMLFLFFSYIGWIYFPLWFLFSKLRDAQEQLAWVEKLHEELGKLEQDYKNKINKNKISKITWKIEFKNISFWYNKNAKILKNISFKVNPWEKVAFVWNTWAGKSTIVNLIFRLWDTNSWEILLDKENINNLSIESLRKNIWLVAQDNSLFNTTIKENLKYANPKATKKEIESALKKAEANFVFDFKDWINTIIWERWLKLSGWEKQRLSIARLFLKNPEILVLDEATSALDNKTERLVHKALEKLMKWRTTIIIAHRLSTIQDADNILVLEKWQIVETGNYKKLMKNKGKFYELANPDKLIIN